MQAQTTIFDITTRPQLVVRDDHPTNLRRVKLAVSATIRAFLMERGEGKQFSMVELTEYVRARHPIAPDSAGRILRDMNQRGEIAYQLVSRSKSLYRVVSVQPRLKEAA